MVRGGVVFGAGFVCGFFSLALLELAFLFLFLLRLLRRFSPPPFTPSPSLSSPSPSPSPSSSSSSLTLSQISSSKVDYPSLQGDIWVAAAPFELEKGTKGKDTGKQDAIKDNPGVHPLKMHASIKGNILFLTDENGKENNISLQGCEILSISGSQEAARKWAKKYPIKLQNRNRSLLDESHICLLYIRTNWEKETWCQKLRAASRTENETQDFYKVNKNAFKGYIADLNNSYPSLLRLGSSKRDPNLNEKGKGRKLETGLAKKRQMFKRLIKKSALKGDLVDSKSSVLMASKSFGMQRLQDEEDLGNLAASHFDLGSGSSNTLAASDAIKGDNPYYPLKTDEKAIGSEKGSISESKKVSVGISGASHFDLGNGSSNTLVVSDAIKGDNPYYPLKTNDKAVGSEKGSISELKKVSIGGEEMSSGSADLPLDQGAMCWNILLSRLYFDFYHSSRIKEAIQRKIQIQLSKVSAPSFTRGIKITNLDLGKTPPIILRLYPLPLSSDAVWAFQADIEYSGVVSLTIETSLDVCDTSSQEKMITQSMEPTLAGEVTADLLAKGLESVGGNMKTDTEARTLGETLEGPSSGTGYLKNLRFSSSRKWTQSMGRLKSVLSNFAEQFSQIPLTLSLKLVSLKGKLLIRVKPSPSDCIWFSFEEMPTIELLTEPSIGDHRISTSPVLDFFTSRIKMLVNEALVNPNSESIRIPWMISETDDWLPQTDMPFPWSPLDTPPLLDSDGTLAAHPGSGHQSDQSDHEAEPSEASSTVPHNYHVAFQQVADGPHLSNLVKPLLETGNRSLMTCRSAPAQDTVTSSDSESSSQSVMESEIGSKKRLGWKKTKVIEIGKKVSEKLQEKRRNMLDRMKEGFEEKTPLR